MNAQKRRLNERMNAELADTNKGYIRKDGSVTPVDFVEYPDMPKEYIVIHNRFFLINKIDEKYYR